MQVPCKSDKPPLSGLNPSRICLGHAVLRNSDRGHGAASLIDRAQEGIRRPCRRIFEHAGALERLVDSAGPPAIVSGRRATAASEDFPGLRRAQKIGGRVA